MNGVYLTKGYNMDHLAFFSQSLDVYKHFEEPVLCHEDMLYIFVWKEGVLNPIAFLGIHENGFIRYLFVLKEYRRLGIGKILLDECKKTYQSITLCCKVSLLDFYQKQDFFIIKNYKKYIKLKHERI